MNCLKNRISALAAAIEPAVCMITVGRTVKDIPAFGKHTVLILRKRRYRPFCGKRFFEDNSFLPRYYRITSRLAAYIISNLSDVRSFTSVAHEVNLSVSTIIRVFDCINYGNPRQLPEVVSIDKFKGNTNREKYQCILTNPVHHRILDILPTRYSHHLTAYFKQLDRSQTKHFVSDMWSTYADIARTYFKDAVYVIDKYHYIRQVFWAFEAVRKEEQKKFSKTRRIYFKRSRTLLNKRYQFLAAEQKQQKIVANEIENLKSSGVRIQTDVVIGETITVDELFEQGFQAVFIGSGAGLPSFLRIEGENFNGVYSANEYLTRINLMKAYDRDYQTPIFKGKAVAVVGGGNVAMDAARSALRIGAEKVSIIYRRGMEELPARHEEVEHAMEKGVEFRLLTNPVRFIGDENGWLMGVECVNMELGEPDESGRRRPAAKSGSEFFLGIDTAIIAVGTSPNPLIRRTTQGLKINSHGCIVASEETGATSRKGVYAGGDAVTGAPRSSLPWAQGERLQRQ